MQRTTLEDLPPFCKVLVENIYAVLTYEKLIDSSFRYFLTEFTYKWECSFNNYMSSLIIPKNVGKNTPPSLKINKSNFKDLDAFCEEIVKIGLIVFGCDDSRRFDIEVLIIDQNKFIEAYNLCKKFMI
ncbi:hypothetical protein D3C75_402940 [compost metagenome]